MILLEIASFFFIYHSNHNLYTTLNNLKISGNIIVPNNYVLPSLEKILPAFYSSLFILFTGGIAVSLIICICVILFWQIKFQRNGNSYALTFPPGFLVSLTISILMVIFFADQSIFLRTRDYLLLSTPPGRAINNFYYRFTPYAAQAVNPPFKRQIKACFTAPEIYGDGNTIRILSKFGWLNTKKKSNASLVVEKSLNGDLIFKHKNKAILTVSTEKFHQNPALWLKKYSQKTDCAFLIRVFCAAGLFIGLPFFCFIVVFRLFFLICRRLKMSSNNASVLSGMLISVFTVVLLIYLNPVNFHAGIKNIKTLQHMLNSKNCRARIEGLRIIYHLNENIWQFPDYCRLHVDTSSIAEKYWLVKVLSKSGAEKNIFYLKKLLKTRSINVQSAVIKALSNFKCSNDLAVIYTDTIMKSRHWYVQQAAYNAFKRCQ